MNRHIKLNTLICGFALLILTIPIPAIADYPDLKDCHNPELQQMLNQAMRSQAKRLNETGHGRKMGAVVADITDLRNPQVAWHRPNTMYYAASLPKIAIVLGVLTQVDQGVLTLDQALEHKLVGMIRNSSNQYATELLNLVGMKELMKILMDERYGKLYDPERGGGLWVGKEYGKGGVRIGDPLHDISHGATAMQAARFYYGAVTGTIINVKHIPLLSRIFGDPAIPHKFVKGLNGRNGVDLYRKSGTWRDYHADSGVVVHDDFIYIVVYIEQHPDAGNRAAKGIKIVDDVMQKFAHYRKSL